MAITEFSDDFNRANNTNLNTWSNWGTESGDLEIYNNELRNVTMGSYVLVAFSPTFNSPHHTVSAKVKASSLSGSYSGVVGRYSNASNYLFARIDWLGNTISLRKVVNGTETELGTATRVVSASQQYLLKLTCSNNRVEVWWENELSPLISVEETALNTNTQGGVRGIATSPNYVYWDDFNLKQISGIVEKSTNYVYQSTSAWKVEGNSNASNTSLLVLEYPVILAYSTNIVFYVMPINTWATLPTTYVDGTNPSQLWIEIEYYANSSATYKIKRYSYQETQQALIANMWTPIKISGSNYGLNASNCPATIRLYLAKGEISKYIYVDAVPKITGMYFDADLIGV